MGRSNFIALSLPSHVCAVFHFQEIQGLAWADPHRAGTHPGNATQHTCSQKLSPNAVTHLNTTKKCTSVSRWRKNTLTKDTSTRAQEWSAQFQKDWCAGWCGQLHCFKTHIQTAISVRHKEKPLCIPYSDPSLYLTLSPFPRRQIFVLSQQGGHSEM